MLFYFAYGISLDKLIVELKVSALTFCVINIADKLCYDGSADFVAGLFYCCNSWGVKTAELNIIETAYRNILTDLVACGKSTLDCTYRKKV